MLRPAFPIETARLTLRPLRRDDLDDVHAYQSRPEVVRYLYWDVRDRAQVSEYLDGKLHMTGFEREGDGLVLAIVWREVGRVVGQVSLEWLSQEHRQGEIGFILNPDYQGRGLLAWVALRRGLAGAAVAASWTARTAGRLSPGTAPRSPWRTCRGSRGA